MMDNILKYSFSIVVLLLCLSFSATAQQNTHTVQKSETLFGIAQKYGVEVSQLKDWNNLQGNSIEVGQSLIIKPQDNASNSKNNSDAITHTVKSQETLFSISKQYNVRIAELKSWNDLSTNNLEVGQELTIYPSKASKQPQQSVVVDKETQQNSYYTVKSGDSLYRIAQQHGMTIDELKKINDLSSNTIRVGQRLTVRSNSAPPSVAKSMESSPQGKFIEYKVSESSISLENLLSKFKMSEEEFRELNPGLSSTTFRSGRTFTMLAPPSRNYDNPYLKSTNLENLGSTAVTQYSKSERAKTTTSGELYNPQALTAAHSNISLGSVIFIENQENKKGIYVRINDRDSGNGLKLSSTAWQALDFNSNSPSVTIYQNK